MSSVIMAYTVVIEVPLGEAKVGVVRGDDEVADVSGSCRQQGRHRARGLPARTASGSTAGRSLPAASLRASRGWS